jgi:hypothetical protein
MLQHTQCGGLGSQQGRDPPQPSREAARFRCSQRGTDRADFVVMSRDNPQPW